MGFFYNRLWFFPSLENLNISSDGFPHVIKLLFPHLRRSPQISCSPRSGTEPRLARHSPPLLPFPSPPPPPPPPTHSPPPPPFPSPPPFPPPPPSNVLSFFSLTHMPPAGVTHSQSVFGPNPDVKLHESCQLSSFATPSIADCALWWRSLIQPIMDLFWLCL